MKRSTGAALLAGALMVSVATPASAEATVAKKTQATAASDVSAWRTHRHDRYAYRRNTPYPMYYGRPVYYAPAPFLPIPPLWGYGWEWW